MKKSFFSSMLSVLGLAFFCVVLAGCENFLKGSNAKDELDRQIAWANAPKVTVKIRLDSSDYGTIYPPSIKVAKGDTFTVEFTQNPSTVFRYWTITNPTTGEALDDKYFSVIKEDIIENVAENTVTRKLTLKMNSLPGDMEIRPKCYLKTEIVPPEFKQLIIARTEEDAKNGTDLITVSENSEKNEFNYYATKNNFDGDSAIVAANIDNFHIKDSLFIDVEAYDANSGVDKIVIFEKRLRDSKGQLVLGEESRQSEPYTFIVDDYSQTSQQFINYKLRAKDDGVVNIKIVLYDKNRNTTTREMDVIRDTICDNFFAPNTFIQQDSFADDNPEYTISVQWGCGYEDEGTYIIDLDGKEYRDYETYSFPEEGNTEEIALKYKLGDKIKKLVKIENGYEGEALKEFPKSNYIFNNNYDVSDYDDANTQLPSGTLLYDFGTASSVHAQVPAFLLFCNANDYKDSIVRVTAFDRVGNENSREYIQPKGDCINHVELKDSSVRFFWGNNKNDLKIHVMHYNEAGEFVDYKNYEYYTIIQQGQNVSVSTFYSGQVFASDKFFFNDDGSLRTGIFYCYIYSQPLKGGQLTTRLIKPYIVYNGVTPSDVTALENCSIPDFSCSPIPAEINQGNRTINLNIVQPFTAVTGITYMAVCSGGNLTAPLYFEISDFASPLTFTLPPSDTNYSINIMLRNQSKQTKIDETKAVSLLLDEDTVPPNSLVTYPDDYRVLLFSDKRIIYLENGKTFDNVGLKKDNDFQETMTIKYFYSYTSDFIERGIDWNASYVKQYKQPYSDSHLELPFDGSRGDYCYVLLEDQTGNTKECCLYIKTIYEPNIEDSQNSSPKVIIEDNKMELYWKESPSRTLNWNVTNYYVKNGEWLPTKQSNKNGGFFHTDNWNKDGSYFASNPGIDERPWWDYKPKLSSSYDYVVCKFVYKLDEYSMDERYSFIKSYIWGLEGYKDYNLRYNKTAGYKDVVYFYPRYISTPGDYQCNKKVFIKGGLGIYVETDFPCLVHTLYCSNNLGNEIQAWLNEGIEVNVEQFGFMYGATGNYTEPLEKIPEGKYYTSIIHYADGTMEMTSVLIK